MNRNMFRFVSLGILAVTAMAGQVGFADDLKEARANDEVSKYGLSDSGEFYRIMRGGTKDIKCAVTGGVEDFKISGHPEDAALVYFVKKNSSGGADLYYSQKNGIAASGNNCPKADAKLLMKDVAKVHGKYSYGVISKEDTNLVNYALDGNKTFTAWPRSSQFGAPVQVGGIEAVTQNGCYGEKGKPFSKKIAFLQKDDGTVLTLESDGKIVAQGKFSDIKEFKKAKNVCGAAQESSLSVGEGDHTPDGGVIQAL